MFCSILFSNISTCFPHSCKTRLDSISSLGIAIYGSCFFTSSFFLSPPEPKSFLNIFLIFLWIIEGKIICFYFISEQFIYKKYLRFYLFDWLGSLSGIKSHMILQIIFIYNIIKLVEHFNLNKYYKCKLRNFYCHVKVNLRANEFLIIYHF